MSKLKKILISLFIFCFSFQGIASLKMNFDDCVSTLIKNNPLLLKANNNLQSKEYEKLSAKSAFFPKVGLFVSDSQSKTNALSFTNNYKAGLNADLNLFSGFKDYGNFKKKLVEEESQKATLILTKAQITSELKSLYSGYLYAKELKELTLEIVKRREENFKMVELRYQSGLENKGTVLLSKAYFEEAEYQVLKANNILELNKSSLLDLLGLEKNKDIEFVGEIPKTLNLDNPDFSALAKTNPEFLAVQKIEESSYYNLLVSNSNFYPQLNLSGQYLKSDDKFFPEDQKVITLSLTLNFSLFEGGKDYFTKKSATYNYYAQKNESDQTYSKISQNLKDKYFGYIEAAKKFEVDRKFNDASIVRAEIARKKYNNGLITFENWDLIETDLITRQQTFLASKKNKLIAESLWEEAQGKGVIP